MPPKLSNTKGVTWLTHEVNELLNVWADDGIQEQLAGRLHNQCVYGKISDRLRARGIVRSAEQCREKIKKLKRDYRAIVDNNYAPAFARKLLSCYDKMHAVLGARTIAKPQFLIESLNMTKTNLCEPNESLKATPKEDGSVPGKNGLLCSSSQLLVSQRPEKDNAATSLTTLLSQAMAATVENERLPENEDDTPSEDDNESESKQSSEQPDGTYQTGSDATSGEGEATHVGNKASSSRESSNEETSQPNRDKSYENKKNSRKRGYELEGFLEKFLEMQEVLHEKFLALEEKRFKQEMEIEKQRLLMEEKRRDQERQQEQRLFQTLSAMLSSQEKNVSLSPQEGESSSTTTDEQSQSTSCFDNLEDAPILLGL